MITGSFTLIGIQDAILIESCYKATQQNIPPSTPEFSSDDGFIPEGWSDTLISVSASMPFVWESQRKKDGGMWSEWSTPVLKNSWGKQGAKMRMRNWEEGIEYLSGAEGEEFYDIVVYETKLYLCTKTHTSSSSNNPIESMESYLGYWESAQQWTFIATQLLLAGKIVSDKITADLIDANGITAKDVNLTGKITATSGKIGGWTISGNDLICYGFNTRINVEASGSRFMRINDSEEMMCSIRADGNTGLRLSTFGKNNNTIGLDVLCNASGYGYAIRSHGNVLLRARDSEKILINGLAVNVVHVGSSSYTVLSNDDYINIETETNLTMPNSMLNKGKIYYIRLTSGKYPTPTVKITSIASRDFRAVNGTIVDYIQFNDMKPRILISDGLYWNEYISST